MTRFSYDDTQTHKVNTAAGNEVIVPANNRNKNHAFVCLCSHKEHNCFKYPVSHTGEETERKIEKVSIIMRHREMIGIRQTCMIGREK